MRAAFYQKFMLLKPNFMHCKRRQEGLKTFTRLQEQDFDKTRSKKSSFNYFNSVNYSISSRTAGGNTDGFFSADFTVLKADESDSPKVHFQVITVEASWAPNSLAEYFSP